MNRLKKLALAAAVAITFIAGAAPGIEVAKVNEYEGQHRVARKGSFDLDAALMPVAAADESVYKKGSFDLG